MQIDPTPKFYHLRFPQKMWVLLELRPDAIFWSSSEKTIILNYRVLDDYLISPQTIFKTSNLSSFIRQLNLYGFRKVTSHSQDPVCNSKNPFLHEFYHEYFISGRKELLHKIVRKPLSTKRKLKPEARCRSPCGPRLQKARRIFRAALKKVLDASNDDANIDDALSVIDVDDYVPSVGDIIEPLDSTFEMDKTSEESHNLVTVCETIPFDPSTDDMDTKELSKRYLDVPVIDISDDANAGGPSSYFDFASHFDDEDQVVSVAEMKNGRTSEGNLSQEWDQMISDISVENCSSDLKGFYSQINQTFDIMYY